MYRINILLKQKQRLFHLNDLALLWKITNQNTLYTTIKRYVKKGVLIRLHKGFYSTVSIDQLHPWQLGVCFLHCYAYLSLESVLTASGIIFQSSPYFTFISNISKKFTIGPHSYLVRKLNNIFLYQSTGIIEKEGIKIATKERAIADMLYFNPVYYFDDPSAIDWKKVKTIQKEVGYIL